MRIPIIMVVAAFALSDCNANQGVNPYRSRPPRSSPAITKTTILTIPSATPRTIPGVVAAAARRNSRPRQFGDSVSCHRNLSEAATRAEEIGVVVTVTVIA
jgi:hypothetical protein